MHSMIDLDVAYRKFFSRRDILDGPDHAACTCLVTVISDNAVRIARVIDQRSRRIEPNPNRFHLIVVAHDELVARKHAKKVHDIFLLAFIIRGSNVAKESIG